MRGMRCDEWPHIKYFGLLILSNALATSDSKNRPVPLFRLI